MRRYTILNHRSQYGDGVTQEDADRMARAEREAILRAFPTARVTVICGFGSQPADDDATIALLVDDLHGFLEEKGIDTPSGVVDFWNGCYLPVQRVPA